MIDQTTDLGKIVCSVSYAYLNPLSLSPFSIKS
jgi:hypothetical protein